MCMPHPSTLLPMHPTFPPSVWEAQTCPARQPLPGIPAFSWSSRASPCMSLVSQQRVRDAALPVWHRLISLGAGVRVFWETSAALPWVSHAG